jgi:uroporphyrinogen III methyltransferase/synthase
MKKRSEDHHLSGISVLVTRTLEQSAGLVEDLTSMGAEVIVIPAVSISPLPDPEGFSSAIARADTRDFLVFTSVNGVAYTQRLLDREGVKPQDLPPALCVGEKTADAWEEAGGKVAAYPEHYTAEALLESLGDDIEGRSFLIFRPEVVKTQLGQTMKSLGAIVEEVVIYRTVPSEAGAQALKELVQEGKPDIIFFASPSAIDGILTMAGREDAVQSPRPDEQGETGAKGEKPGKGNLTDSILRIPVICIGPTTALAAEEAGFKEIYFPDEYTAEGMVDELLVIAGGIKKSGVQSPGSRS